MHPKSEGISGYPAFFNRCSIREMSRLCRKTDFKEIQTIPYYRANYYFEVFYPAFLLVTLWENFCKKYMMYKQKQEKGAIIIVGVLMLAILLRVVISGCVPCLIAAISAGRPKES